MQVLSMVRHCHAAPIPATSCRHPLARRFLTEMQCSFETRDEFLGYGQSFHLAHFTSNCASILSFIVHVIAQPFIKFRMPRFLAAKCPTIRPTILLFKSHFFLRKSRIQLSLTSYFLPAARFSMFSAFSIILSFSFAVNEQ